MRILVLGFALVALLLPITAARAIEASDPPPRLPDSPLLLSAYGLSGATAESPDFVELYNDSSSVLKLNDWQLEYNWSLTATAPPNTAVLDTLKFPLVTKQSADDPDIYLKPKQYTVLSFGSSVPTARLVATAIVGNSNTYISRISLSNDMYKPYQKSLTKPQPGAWFLGETATGFTSTGTYYQYPSDKIRSVFTLYSGGLYQLGVDAPRSFPLTPIEIVANPRTCAPTDTATACHEYIKFYNGTDIPIDFAGTALHIGTQVSSSAMTLNGIVQPGDYAVFSWTPSGGELEITNSGGYVWLSDAYGITRYDNTVIEYADASSTTKKGMSWALIDDTWQWAVPSPGGANQQLPKEPAAATSTETGILSPCRSDQYRNPETNRCKLIATASSSLTPCAANQYRNPETNRCRSISSSTSSLTPCDAGEYRNPATNRCKAVATTASTLTPCKDGYERNLDTNRCRKQTSSTIPVASGAVEMTPGANQSIGWVAFAAVALLAAGYGAWEWRSEIAGLFGRVVSLLKR